MPTIAIRAPKDFSAKESKCLLVKALERGTVVELSSNIPTRSERIAVDAIQISKLERISHDFSGTNAQSIASCLILAQYRLDMMEKKRALMTHTLERIVADGGIAFRQGQSEATMTLRMKLSSKDDILMLESPTGSGKTLSELCAATDLWAANPGKLIVIAVPTLQLMRQIEQEYSIVQDVLQDDAPEIGFIVGRDNFISLNQFQNTLNDPDNAHLVDAAHAWLDTAARMDGTSISRLPYQTRDLQNAIPLFPPCSIDDLTDEDDPGMMAYRAQFTRAKSVGILVVTHTMLALDTKLKRIRAMQASKEDGLTTTTLKKTHALAIADVGNEEITRLDEFLTEHYATYDVTGVLPEFDCLIVDEGHLLEQAFSRINSDEFSLYGLLRNECLTETNRTQMRRAFDMLVKTGKGMRDNKIDLSSSSASDSLDHITSILSILKRSRKKDSEIRRAISMMNSLIKNVHRAGFTASVDYSPVYRYPRLRVGAKSSFIFLQFLWAKTKTAAILSATLLLPDSTGDWSPSYVSRNLCIPKDRIRIAHLPTPDWLTKPVTIFMPEVRQIGARFWLQPPSSRRTGNIVQDGIEYQSAIDIWVTDELVPVMSWIANTAAGGTLVLLSSYQLAEKLHSQLHAYHDRMVVASSDFPMSAQKKLYEDIHATGRQPIWISVGGAWTGLNLKDDAIADSDALNDMFVTDLVIPRLPMGMNRSISHEYRVSYLGWTMEISETLMLLKQGIGRLVRREGIAHNRRIFILDARLYDSNAYTALRRGVEQLIVSYQKKIISFIGKA